MSKKFVARYTENDELGRMIGAMKEARKESGYTQLQFCKLIGVSRKTVIHIEGFAECTILSLECEVVKRWYSTCSGKIPQQDLQDLQDAIQAYLFAPSTLSTTSQITTAKNSNNQRRVA